MHFFKRIGDDVTVIGIRLWYHRIALAILYQIKLSISQYNCEMAASSGREERRAARIRIIELKNSIDPKMRLHILRKCSMKISDLTECGQRPAARGRPTGGL